MNSSKANNLRSARQRIARTLIKWRESRGLSLETAADLLRIPIEYLIQIESGEIGLPAYLVNEVTSLYGTDDQMALELIIELTTNDDLI